jgi:WD40 repeat protein/tRNA A-37 threonylcarbamoyl transferase component Bud32
LQKEVSAMLAMSTPHPSADQLRAFAQGLLAPDLVAEVEGHVAGCDSCCRLLEETPADSFVSRLRAAEPAGQGTTADATAATLVEPAPVPPELADHPRYRVLGLIGQGGMGAVYKARHTRMERLVALKVINPGLLRNPATVERFHQEVRAAARLHHANIVTAHDADQAGGLHFLVMECVEGRSLADLVRERGPLPAAEACDYVRQAALGLQHAHEQRMVHRDIKPHNLMVTVDGQVKILDFGLARLARAPDEAPAGAADVPGTLTGAGTVMGSADYIAPEQAADPRTADIRADIYALGCTLYHLLTGRPPFADGTVQEKIARHATAPLPPLAEVPAELAAVVARMTAKDPVARYTTPAEVAQALAAFALPSGRKRGEKSGGKRKHLVLLSVAGVAAALLAAVVILRLSTDRGDIVVQTDSDLELTVEKDGRIVRIRDPKTGQIWELDTKDYRLARADDPNGLAIELPGRGTITLRRKDGTIITVSTAPRGTVPEPVTVRLPTFEELAKRPNAADVLKHADITDVARAYIGGGNPNNVPAELVAVLGDVRFRCSDLPGPMAFSPDNKQLVVANDRGEIRFLDVQSGKLLGQLLSKYTPTKRLAFSPDGKRLAGTRADGKFCVLDAQTGRLLWQRPAVGEAGADQFVFSGDGKTILLSTTSGKNDKPPASLLRCDADNGTASPLAEGKRWTSFAISADGTKSAEMVAKDLYLRNLATKVVRNVVLGSARCVALTPDGQHIAVARWTLKKDGEDKRFNHEVIILDAEGKVLHQLADQATAILAFAPDGKTLMAVSDVGAVAFTRWDVVTGKLLRSWTLPKLAQAGDLALSPDGKILARRISGAVQVELFDTETGRPLHADAGRGSSVAALAFSPDGKYLASSDRSAVTLWDLATARVARVWDVPDVTPLAFSPDSKVLAAAGARVEVYRVGDGGLAYSSQVYGQKTTAIAFTPGGTLLASGAEDHLVRIHNLADGKEQRLLNAGHPVRTLSFSADGKHLYSGGHNGISGKLRVWEVATGLERHDSVLGAIPKQIELTTDSGTLAILVQESAGEVWLIDWKTGQAQQKRGSPNTDAANWPVLGPQARLMASKTALGNSLVVAEPGTDPFRRRVLKLAPAGASALDCAAFSPDGRYLAVGNLEGVICLLRLSEQGKVPELPVALPTIEELAARPNAADTLKHANVPEITRAYLGTGDPKEALPEVVAVLGDTRFRFAGSHGPLAYSPDGKFLALAKGGGKFVTIFDAATGRLLREFPSPFPLGYRLAFTPDGKMLSGIGPGGKFGLIDPDSGHVIWELKDTKLAHPSNFAFSPDGKTVGLVDGVSATVEEHDAATGKLLNTWNVNWKAAAKGMTALTSLALHPDHRQFAVLSSEPDGALWDSKMGLVMPLGPQAVRAAFSADGTLLAVAHAAKQNAAGQVILYGPTFWVDLDTLPQEWPVLLTFTPRDKLLILVGRRDGDVVVTRWDPASGLRLTRQTLPLPRGVAVECALSPDSRQLAVTTSLGAIVHLYDTETGKPLDRGPGGGLPIHAVALSPDGRLLASADERAIRLWETATGQLVDLWQETSIHKLLFSPDGKTLAWTSNLDGRSWVTLLDIANVARRKLEGHSGDITDLAFSPDSKYLATASKDHTAWIWRLDRLEVVAAVPHGQNVVWALAWSPDGQLLASVSGSRVVVRDSRHGGLTTHHLPWQLDPDYARRVAFLADGKTLALLDWRGVRFFDALTGKVGSDWPLPPEQRVASPLAEFGPLGSHLALAGKERPLIVLEPGSEPLKLRTFATPSRPVSAIAFSADGRYVVCGHQDGTVCLLRLAERGQVPALPVAGGK